MASMYIGSVDLSYEEMNLLNSLLTLKISELSDVGIVSKRLVELQDKFLYALSIAGHVKVD